MMNYHFEFTTELMWQFVSFFSCSIRSMKTICFKSHPTILTQMLFQLEKQKISNELFIMPSKYKFSYHAINKTNGNFFMFLFSFLIHFTYVSREIYFAAVSAEKTRRRRLRKRSTSNDFVFFFSLFRWPK